MTGAKHATIPQIVEIHKMLTDHFVDGRYQAGWDDNVLAAKIGCGLQSVVRVRRKVFGNFKKLPNRQASMNEEIADLQKRVAALEAKR